MTYRATRGGRAARRAKHKEQVRQEDVRQGVRRWLLDHPPRVAPVLERGEWRDDNLHGPRYLVEFSQTPRPERPNYVVPIYPNRSSWSLSIGDPMNKIMVEQLVMRPVPMRLVYGATDLRWWNWEPVRGAFGDAEADIYRFVGKARSFALRLREMLDHYMLQGAARAASRSMFPSEEELDWFGVLVEALDDWRGKVRTRYVVPGARAGGRPEEMTSW